MIIYSLTWDVLEMWCPVYVLTLMHDYLFKEIFMLGKRGVTAPSTRTVVPPWQHKFSNFSTFMFSCVKFWFSIPFSPTRPNHLNQSSSTIKQCFPSSKQLNPILPKSLISQKHLKQLFTQKPNFHPNDSTRKTLDSKQKS